MTRAVTLQKMNNVRDLGGIPVEGGRVVVPGLMFRGGAFRGATDDDLDLLFNKLGIRRVIDLRIGYERAAKPDPDYPGAENLFIPFYDNELVGYEYFKPVPGTIAIGHDFACSPDDFYRDMANELTAKQISQAVHATTDAVLAGQPVYFHCSNGKDRAGILALIILEMLGASEQEILADYLMTNEWRDTEIGHIYERFLRLCQGDEDFARRITAEHCARPENLAAFREAVDEHYGSMATYIRDILGFSDAACEHLRARLTMQPSESDPEPER